MDRSKLKPRPKMKSSPEARKLIKAYIKHYKTEREAARRLNMTHGQLNALKIGRIKDTPAIKVAIRRADARAKRAWSNPWKYEARQWIDDQATLKVIKGNHDQNTAMLDVLIKVE